MDEIAVPKNSSLNQGALDYYSSRYDLSGLETDSREYCQELADTCFYFLRAEDVPQAVDKGWVDEGITGLDLFAEYSYGRRPEIGVEHELGFGEVELVLAGESPEVLERDRLSVATSFPAIARDKLEDFQLEIIDVDGSSEVYPSFPGVDATVEVVETGSTLERNGLQQLDTLMESEAVLLKKPDTDNQVGEE